MGDVGPPGAVALGDLDRVAEQLGLGLGPELADALDRELALVAARGVDAVLELVHRDLAEDGRDLALDRLGQQARGARPGSSASLEQAAEDDLLGEHRGRLGDRQRGVLVEDALLAGERLVQAVAELVGEGEHVAAAVGVVEHHVGVDRGDGRGAEGAAALDRRRRRVDPALVEEALDAISAARSENEANESSDQLAALLPGDLLVVAGDRRHAVVVGEALEAEQPAPWSRTSGGPARSGP